ncbi:hypothetical protein AOLI_G00318510 [Acnodon oligacanthus]
MTRTKLHFKSVLQEAPRELEEEGHGTVQCSVLIWALLLLILFSNAAPHLPWPSSSSSSPALLLFSSSSLSSAPPDLSRSAPHCPQYSCSQSSLAVLIFILSSTPAPHLSQQAMLLISLFHSSTSPHLL